MAGVCSCSGHTGWSVEGNIEGAENGTRLALEEYDNGRWLLIDSLTVKNETFNYKSDRAGAYTKLMRVTLPGSGSVYFPIDSADAISIATNAAHFSPARISGSANASTFAQIDSTIAAYNAIGEDLQRALIPYITADTTGIVAYYTVTKSLGNTPIFHPGQPLGNRVYGAAAQVYATHKPDDPRGAALQTMYFRGRQALGLMPEPEATTVEVPAAGLIDIVRYDWQGTSHSLDSLAAPGKTVLLSFTSYDMPSSADYNHLLNNLYTAHHSRGLEIYQIAFDQNEATWKEAARNLPWTAVWNAPSDGEAVLVQYNVGAVPVTYIIRNGDIIERVDNPADLSARVNALF